MLILLWFNEEAWSRPVEKVPSLHPPSPQDLVKGQGRIAVGERSKDSEGDKDSEREKSYSKIPDREEEFRPKSASEGRGGGEVR